MTLTVLVPSSLVRESDDKREATRKLGYVARAAAVFRVDRLIVFPDPDGEGTWGGDFVETVLAYAATPPYLRREVWGRRDELEYAGVLPPLHVSSRAGSGSDGSGSLRQGLVTQVGSEGRVRVNCGLQHPISLIVPPDMAVDEGERVTVRISSRRPVRAKLVDDPLPGFDVSRMDLAAALDRDGAGVRIATSRHGTPLTVAWLQRLVPRVATEGCTIAFGAPERGLPALLDVEPTAVDTTAASTASDAVDTDSDGGATEPGAGSKPEPHLGFDHWINTIPNQGSETVRTEEAMFASLAPLTLTE